MSIKGISQELYIGKKDSNIITQSKKRINICYSSLERIEYLLSENNHPGKIVFKNKTKKEIVFNFQSDVNESVLRAINFWNENIPYIPTLNTLYDKEVSEINSDFYQLKQDIKDINAEIDNLKLTFQTIESAQEIINALSETAKTVNNTVSPTEFFDSYDKMYYLVNKLEAVPNIDYSQQPPNEIRKELEGQRRPAIQNMIGRYYNHIMAMDGSVDVFYNTISKYFSYMDEEHKNYVNQLYKSGHKTNKDKTIRKFKIFYMNFAYIINRILFPPAKVMFVFWTFCWISVLSSDTEISFGKRVFMILFGYLLLCGISNAIYYQNKEKYNKYMIRITGKKIKRLKKSMQEIDPVRYQNEFVCKNIQQKEKTNTINYDYMDGHDFEYFCSELLKKNGFYNVEVTQGSGDHGIDILAEKDAITYAIQCKCYSSNIGNAAVQQAHTGKSLYHKDIAVVLTNRYFTPQAKEEANALGVKLWDRDKLNELIQSEKGVSQC